ncbi:Uncharacterised protein [Segatella copri]|nr:Uncharacterised protein [Segatella copri]
MLGFDCRISKYHLTLIICCKIIQDVFQSLVVIIEHTICPCSSFIRIYINYLPRNSLLCT